MQGLAISSRHGCASTLAAHGSSTRMGLSRYTAHAWQPHAHHAAQSMMCQAACLQSRGHQTASSVKANVATSQGLTTRQHAAWHVAPVGCVHAARRAWCGGLIRSTHSTASWSVAATAGSDTASTAADTPADKRTPTQEEIQARIQANRARRAARVPYCCPACSHPIMAAQNLPSHMEGCCPDLSPSQADWGRMVQMPPPDAPPAQPSITPLGSQRPHKPRPVVDDAALRSMLETAAQKEAAARDMALHIAFRTGERDASGELVRHGPDEIARRMDVPVERASRLLSSALRAVPLLPDTSEPLDVVHEADGLLAVNKPPGVSTAPAHRYKGTSMVNRVMGYLGGECTSGPHVLHRLDMDTSGLLLFATDKTVVSSLHTQFRRRSVRKLYLALAIGVPDRSTWVVDAPIGRHPTEQVARLIDGVDAKPALTSFTVVASAPHVDLEGAGAARGLVFDGRRTPSLKGVSLLACAPRTGRTHQIRLHAAHSGHPLLGDELYGVQGPWITRQALHAAALEVALPAPPPAGGAKVRRRHLHTAADEGRRVAMWASLPSDIQAALEDCGIEWGSGQGLEATLSGVWADLIRMASEHRTDWTASDQSTDLDDD